MHFFLVMNYEFTTMSGNMMSFIKVFEAQTRRECGSLFAESVVPAHPRGHSAPLPVLPVRRVAHRGQPGHGQHWHIPLQPEHGWVHMAQGGAGAIDDDS